MTKEELDIDNKRLDFNEKVQFVVKREELKEQDIRLNKLCFDYQEKEKQIEELEKENAELKADNDARKFAMVMSEKVEKQLREQIEKMECCGNCDHYHWSNGEDWCNDHYGQPVYDEECKGKWKLRR